MNLNSLLTKIKRWLPSKLEAPFWIILASWALLPTTKTPSIEIDSVAFNSKDIVSFALACFYLWIPSIDNSDLSQSKKAWHCHLPIITFVLLVYAGFSMEWSGMKDIDSVPMLYTLLLTGSAALAPYFLIRKKRIESIRPFLWGLTVCIAVIGLLYSLDSILSLGLGTTNTYESDTFGAQRVRGPLFVSTTGFFILTPALGFAVQEVILSRTQRPLKVIVVFILLLTIIGLGARSALIILGIFFLLIVLSMKNTKQAITSLTLIAVLTATAGALFFSKANPERLQTLESEGRYDTYSVSFQAISSRDANVNFFGSGYGSYWPWYSRESTSFPSVVLMNSDEYYNLIRNPYGDILGIILYHPHSTFLLLIVELGAIGLFYFIFLWGVLAWLLFRNFRGAKFTVFNSSIFASAFSMLFDFFIFRSTQVNFIWWLFLFGALALNFEQNLLKQTNMNENQELEEEE